MSSCGLGCCEIIPMALIDVFGLLVRILHVVHEVLIWLCFGHVQFLELLWNVIMWVSILWGSYPYGLDVIGLLMMIYAVHECTIWLCFWGCPVVQNVKCSIGLLSTSLNATVPKQAALGAWILIVGHSLRCIALESQGVRTIRSSLTSQTAAM